MKLNLIQERIIELFTVFVTQVRGSTAMSRMDINRVSEEVLLPIFSTVFNCPRLKNLNHTKYSNYPGVDLGDEESKVAFQVTSTNNTERIKQTLTKFVKHELYKDYDRLIIYILTEKQDSYSGRGFEEIIQGKFHFDKDRDIIDYRDVLKVIASFQINEARVIERILEANFGNNESVFEVTRQAKSKEVNAAPNQNSAGNHQQPLLFSVPFERNRHFTGRDAELTAIREAFKASPVENIQVIYGMPGVGKTQTVIEYCYRHRNDYSLIGWINSETPQTISSSLVEIARHTGITPSQTEYRESVSAVLNYTARGLISLLVFDNVEDFELVRSLLPSDFRGHLILTTRGRAVGGIGRGMEIRPMIMQYGADLLLLRAQLPLSTTDGLAEARDRIAAENISVEVGGLPLALDQAGAFIEEVPSSPSEYLELYRREGKRLRERRGGLKLDHPSVSITFSLAFRRLEALNPAAVDLIRLSAFLAAEEIPEEIFTIGASLLSGPLSDLSTSPLNLPLAIGEAGRLSLIRREPQRRLFHIHRLIQEVIKDELPDNEKRLWAERAVRMLHCVFPEPEYSVWPVCKRLLSNAIAASELIAEYQFAFIEAAEFLNRIGVYLYYLGMYREAEGYYKQALSVVEKLNQQEEAIGALILNNLAVLCKREGRYSEVESLYNRALQIQIKVFGDMHSHVGTTLNNLGNFYRELGRFELSESFLTRALNVRQSTQGPKHPDVAETLNNLGSLTKWKGNLAAAESYFLQALDIRRESLRDDDPKIATTLIALAHVYRRKHEFTEAERLIREALSSYKRTLGSRHVNTAQALKELGVLYNNQGKYREAKWVLMRSLVIRKAALGTDSLEVGNSLNSLGFAFHHLFEFAKAESLYRQALEIRRQVYGSHHHLTYETLINIAELYEDKGEYDAAERLFEETLHGFETTLGVNHPQVAASLEHLAAIYIRRHEFDKAEPLLQRALSILEQNPGTTDRQSKVLLMLSGFQKD